ncbi:MAG: ribosome-associated translation inhibitor RaiA [Alphaproteobacteria bacterium]|nr:ribosome-associated translation inhibitor RaiA [Alphaproteobacteria bacterium]
MQLHISGRHVDLGSAFQEHVEKRLSGGLNKYLDRIVSLDVVVSKEAHHQFRVDIHGNTGTHSGVLLKSQGGASEIYAAFDDAATKAEKQLRRYKRRLKSHHVSEKEVRAHSARKYVLQTEAHDDELDEKGAPAVIAEKSTNIERLSVSDAVMRMDLANLPALMFFNVGTGRINVVYRRLDGNISWVDPEDVAA